jgi:topoisomerase-4 subunit A
LIIGELKEDAKKFGDERRSPIVARAEAVQIKEQDLMPAEAVTVVCLKQAGFVLQKVLMLMPKI